MTAPDEAILRDVRTIFKRIVPNKDISLSDDDDIFSTGLDSVTFLLMVTELENRFSVTLAADEIAYDQFRNISGIASFIASRLES